MLVAIIVSILYLILFIWLHFYLKNKKKKSLFYLWSFWFSSSLPIAIALFLALSLSRDYSGSFSRLAFETFFKDFSFIIGIASLSIPIGAIVATDYRTKLQNLQIEHVENQNLQTKSDLHIEKFNRIVKSFDSFSHLADHDIYQVYVHFFGDELDRDYKIKDQVFQQLENIAKSRRLFHELKLNNLDDFYEIARNNYSSKQDTTDIPIRLIDVIRYLLDNEIEGVKNRFYELKAEIEKLQHFLIDVKLLSNNKFLVDFDKIRDSFNLFQKILDDIKEKRIGFEISETSQNYNNYSEWVKGHLWS